MTSITPSDDNKPRGQRYYPRIPDQGVAATETMLTKHEGWIFDFRRKHAPKDGETKETILTGDGHELTVVWHPEFGRPNPTSYLALQALFFKSTQEGHPFPESVSFTENELLELMGRKAQGGTDHNDLYRAINALRWVELRGSFTDDKTGKEKTIKLRLFGSAAFIRDDRSKQIRQATIYWDAALRSRMNDGFWQTFNYDRIKGADAVEFAMYKQLFFHFSSLAAYRVYQLKESGEASPENIKRALNSITYTKDKADLFNELNRPGFSGGCFV